MCGLTVQLFHFQNISEQNIENNKTIKQKWNGKDFCLQEDGVDSLFSIPPAKYRGEKPECHM